MTSFRRLLTALATAAALATAGAATAAGGVAPSVARAAAPAGDSRFIAPGSTATVISVGILAAFTAIVLLTTGDDNGGSPASP